MPEECNPPDIANMVPDLYIFQNIKMMFLKNEQTEITGSLYKKSKQIL